MNPPISCLETSTAWELLPDYYKLNISAEHMKQCFKDIFEPTQGTTHTMRVLTLLSSDTIVRELMKAYLDCDVFNRWHSIERFCKKYKWRYVYTGNYISMIILGIQHYCEKLKGI